MAINKNHEFEELNGIKCGIVEKNVPAERVSFLKNLLEYNGYTVVVVPTPPPKVVPPKPVPVAKPPVVAAATAEGGANVAEVTIPSTSLQSPASPIPAAISAVPPVNTTEAAAASPQSPIPDAAPPEGVPAPLPLPETFTVGVTDYTFNPINAIFGRLLHTPNKHVVTLAYWNQEEEESHDEVPYYEKK